MSICKMYDAEVIKKGFNFPEPEWKRQGKDLCCSYCGSIHPDDLKRALQERGCRLEMSDKPYKLYIRRLSVLNASEGGIKFMVHHITSEDVLPLIQEGLSNDVR